MPPVADIDTVAEPPLHAIAEVTLELAITCVGCVTLIVVVVEQPLLSVTVYVCDPAA